MKKVERIEFVIERSEASKETEKFLEGIQQIGKEIFYAVDSTYPDLVDIPECYRNVLDSIRESFVKGELDDATGEDYNEVNQINKAYTYDANGNQIKEADSITGRETLYVYDADNRLKTAVGKTGSSVEYTQENQYNGFGQRVEKKEGAEVTDYFYDGTAVLYTKDKDSAVTSFNLIGAEDNILATARPGSEGATEFYTYTKDIRESTMNLIGADGTAQVSYDYDDFGETTVYDKNKEKPFYNEICYTAGVYDRTTGLYNLNARYYDPENGSFLTQDTYRGSRSRTETLNLYTYCAGNPISYSDP